jgi:hypothetical protein
VRNDLGWSANLHKRVSDSSLGTKIPCTQNAVLRPGSCTECAAKDNLARVARSRYPSLERESDLQNAGSLAVTRRRDCRLAYVQDEFRIHWVAIRERRRTTRPLGGRYCSCRIIVYLPYGNCERERKGVLHLDYYSHAIFFRSLPYLTWHILPISLPSNHERAIMQRPARSTEKTIPTNGPNGIADGVGSSHALVVNMSLHYYGTCRGCANLCASIIASCS